MGRDSDEGGFPQVRLEFMAFRSVWELRCALKTLNCEPPAGSPPLTQDMGVISVREADMTKAGGLTQTGSRNLKSWNATVHNSHKVRHRFACDQRRLLRAIWWGKTWKTETLILHSCKQFSLLCCVSARGACLNSS